MPILSVLDVPCYWTGRINGKGSPAFPTKALAQALKQGKLKAFVRSHRITYKELEKRTGISYGQLRRWATNHEKVLDPEIREVLSRIDAGLREGV
jgi:hypothetical protein